jgi:O-antigen/teichoic acid export membrane protein
MRGWKGHARAVTWGFIDQGVSSATNLGLSLLAGRALGPNGLGLVFLGFSAYLVALGFQRALLTEPLVAVSSAFSAEARHRAARYCLTVAIGTSLVATVVLAVAGAVISGRVGRDLLVFAPWLLPLLLQDYWRTILFRDGRGAAAAANDGIWLVVIAATAPLAFHASTESAVIAWWGAGAAAAAAIGFAQTRCTPERIRVSLSWWRAEARSLGGWLGASSLVYSALSYGTVFVLVGLLGTSQVGGLRAVSVVFAPLSLVGPAIALPGLPAVSRALAVSAQRARMLALWLSFTGVAIIGTYVSLLSLGGSALLKIVFGRSFGEFSNIIWPVGIGQIAAASAIGFDLLLTARRRGKVVLVTEAIGQSSSFGLASGLAWGYGLTGAAWGLAGGSAIRAVSKAAFALIGGRVGGSDATVTAASVYAVPTGPKTG